MLSASLSKRKFGNISFLLALKLAKPGNYTEFTSNLCYFTNQSYGLKTMPDKHFRSPEYTFICLLFTH